MPRSVQIAIIFALLVTLFSCGGGSPGTDTKSQDASDPICQCVSAEPDAGDFRHGAKHLPLPGGKGEDVTVDTILSWAAGSDPGADAPRAGREMQVFHVPRAYLHFAWQNGGDCDLHLEISAHPDKNASRIIVETPKEDTFCPSRLALKRALAPMGVTLGPGSGELSPAVPVEVVGLAFRDFNHKRGSDKVRTPWELHPAMVTVLPQ